MIDGSMVDMLKHSIPDPSMVSSEHFQAIKSGKEWRYDIKLQESSWPFPYLYTPSKLETMVSLLF